MKVLHCSGLEGLLVDYKNNTIKYYDDIDAYDIECDVHIWLKSSIELQRLITYFKNCQFIIK